MLRRHVGRRLHLPLEPILELPWAAFALSSEHPLATKLKQPIASKIRANSSNSTSRIKFAAQAKSASTTF